MRIDQISLKNFRGYASLELPLDSHFNLVIGDNGSGKTAILEALIVASSAFFLGIKGASSRGIRQEDIRIATFEHSEEYQFPVSVTARGQVGGQMISWSRSLNDSRTKSSRTSSRQAKPIKAIAAAMDAQVRKGEDIKLPLLVYYATGRLFDMAREQGNASAPGQTAGNRVVLASRFRAYSRSLAAKSTHKQFQTWFRAKELSRIQKGRTDWAFDLVKNTLASSLPNCADVFYEFDPDKPQGLKIELHDGRILPFHALSDGTRNFFAIIADMSYMCTSLNPHLKEKALAETEGIVLIDELDLHLHPEWQRQIVEVLRRHFPKIQFIATTHSPFLIQEAGQGQLIVLKNSQIQRITSAANLSIEDIAEELQGVANPQWGKLRQRLFHTASAYYQTVKEGRENPELKAALDEAMKPFAIDTAFYAIVEQEKILRAKQNSEG